MKCTKCGSEMPDGKKFCENCGAPIMQNLVSQTQTNVNVDSAKKKNTKIGLFIFIGVILLAIIIGVICFANSVKNKVSAGLNDLNVMGEIVNDFANEVQDEIENEIEEEKYVNVEWKLPLLKTDGKDSYFEYYSDTENLEQYDIYTTAVAVSTNDFWIMEYKLNSDDENVKIINKYYDTVYLEDGEVVYNLIYILIPKGTDINDVCIYVDDNTDACIYGKDNNIEPIEEGKATYGDCITCTVDGIRAYLLLLEFNDNYSRGGGAFGTAGSFDILGGAVECLYIIEKIPERKAYSSDMFKTISEDKDILATLESEDRLQQEQEIYIDDTTFPGENFCGTYSMEIEYIYKEGIMTQEDALKIWENDKIGIKFLDKVEIDWMN